MKQKLTLQFRSRRAAVGYALALVAALGSALCWSGPRTLSGFAVALAFALAGALRLPEEGKLSLAAELGWHLLAFFGLFIAGQLSLNHFLSDMGPRQILLNMASAALPFLLLLALTGRPRLSLCLDWGLILLLVVANYCVFLFRGTELTPADLRTAGTGLSVASNYKFQLHGCFFVSLCLFALILFSSFCLPRRKLRPLHARALGLAATLAVAAFWYPGCYNMRLYSYGDMDTVHSGLMASFSARLVDGFKNLEPEGYSLERVAELEERYRSDAGGAEDSARAPAELPNIIAIMDESFADMDVLNPDAQISEAVIPFFQSLKENTIRGHALASVFGGGTVHSEYAFLSGNALERLSQRSSVYSLYIDAPAHTLVSELERLGYATAATHPYKARGYSRASAYPLLGFDRMDFIESYAQSDLIRAFVSDREMFRFVIERYEQRDPNRPFFLFGITMQNHGGYDYAGPNEAPRYELTGFSGSYPQAEQYLGLLRESDRALQQLIEHFEAVDEPVVIAFFGDHLPNLEAGFYRELYGGDFERLADQQARRTVPFAIWANYDIPEKELELISLHELSDYLYDAAGLELPPYNRFLREMAEVIPAMNALGYYSRSAGEFVPYEEAEGEEAAWLNDYAILQYNNLFDVEHRSEVFFPLSEENGE